MNLATETCRASLLANDRRKIALITPTQWQWNAWIDNKHRCLDNTGIKEEIENP